MDKEIKSGTWVTYPYQFDKEGNVELSLLYKVLKVNKNKNAFLLEYLSDHTLIANVDNLLFFSNDEDIKEFEEKVRKTVYTLDKENNQIYGEEGKELFEKKRRLWYEKMENIKGVL